jgi:uncharacterized RDD family membrane protein YckC
MIDHYTSEFDRWLVGSPAQRAEWRAELVAHLHEASEAGELDAAMARLGGPRAAAEVFSGGRSLVVAPLVRRLLAAVVDYAPLLAISIALLVQGVAWRRVAPAIPYVPGGSRPIVASFPPLIQFAPGEGLLQMVGVPLALGWSILGVAWLEAMAGSTPGKWLLHVRTVSEGGSAVTLWQSIVRRLSLLFGVFAWLDWILTGPRHQRVFDRIARTWVVVDPARPAGAAAAATPAGSMSQPGRDGQRRTT